MSVAAVAPVRVRQTQRALAVESAIPTEAQPPQVHYQPVVLVVGAVCGGIVADRWAAVAISSAFFLWCLLAAAALAVWFVVWKRGQRILSSLSLLLALSLAAAAWHHYCWHLFPTDELGLIAT
jgi:competence protein ComEC